MIEEQKNGRATITELGKILSIRIPTKKNWLIIIFMTAWLGGWYFGEKNVISQLITNENITGQGFLLFWLVGWTVGGLFAISLLLWNGLGYETIIIDQQVLKINKGILDFRIKSKSFDLSSIEELRFIEGQSSFNLFSQKNPMEFWGINGGKIEFDYGMKTIKFALFVDDAEAKFLINLISNRLKSGFSIKNNNYNH